MKITSAQIFEFNAAQAAAMIEKDLGIKTQITKGIDGFTRIKAAGIARLDVSAIGLNRAIDKFLAAAA